MGVVPDPGTVINMPSFSPTIIKWYKPEDESITARNVTYDIQTKNHIQLVVR